MKNKLTCSDKELFEEGVKALHKALGPVKAHAFMGLVLSRKTDYVKISRKQYKGQSVDDIFKHVNAVNQ